MSEITDALLDMRRGCEQWPDGEGKLLALSAIDEIIAEIREEGAASKWLAG